ncbi:hypothetical protein BKA67DRAFT_592948 [Truncatella angustata]|uniref:GST N-terminal domain-containing protein n=1 Tax=Truncatella angustata TaxID=152316 RepID=A0A9P8ZX27_9PEZI|nr:uncharacterized protein BKA67DRAFT_592948 [Truncatella angustata]KAH6652683.1 hypothetical protein BKA67DRAFT_592948 [Truncatella angustata]KAH8195497.1 hypothetical protein TruAng_010326 [Truncatella angustata]
MASSNLPIILFHYPFSPYARRIVWYLTLRSIPYTECIQPFILPRPDLAALGIAYRRIPLLSIGRDVYADTRLILSKLEELYPPSPAHPAIAASTADGRAIERLISRAWIDGGVFAAAASSMPPTLPVMRDPKFLSDRADLVGLPKGAPSPFAAAALEARRPEALAQLHDTVELLEATLLADGRDWILKTEGPGLADIEAVWPFHWLSGMPGALPEDVVGPSKFPRVFAWIKRFEKATNARLKEVGKPKKVKGDDAAKIITGSGFVEQEGGVDGNELVAKAQGFKTGDSVKVWPIDSGSTHKDTGKLVTFTSTEVVIETQGKAGSVRLHAPRHGFRITKAEKGKL